MIKEENIYSFEVRLGTIVNSDSDIFSESQNGHQLSYNVATYFYLYIYLMSTSNTNYVGITNESESLDYSASPTLSRFHSSDQFVRAALGPIGSGKSVACVIEMFMRSLKQEPNQSGVRKTRWVVVRNTYRELIDTTMQTFFDWIPKSLGLYSAMNMKFTINTLLDDGTTLYIEFLFRALDKPADVKKLLSLEMTGMWINEAREIPKAILDMGIGRLGRYPNKRDGGCTWYGMILDTNPPDSDHWFYTLFEENLPSNYSLFHQPSGTSQNAENVDNLPKLYYQNMQAGKDQEWINVYVHGNYGFITDGKPVYPEYHDDVHATDEDLYETLLHEYELSKLTKPTIYIGIDFGLTPAASFGYITSSGAMHLIDELVTFDMGALSFGKLLREKINTQFHGFPIEIYGDPAGDQRAQTDEITPFQILSNQGVDAFPTYTNDPLIRRESVAEYLLRLDFSGKPSRLLGSRCSLTRKAFAGGYKYKRMQVTGDERYMDKPDKNRYSHVSDAVQYLFLGAVGGTNVVGGFDKSTIDYSHSDRAIM